MSKRIWMLTAALLAPLIALGGAALADEEHVTKIKIKKLRSCEGEGCEEGARVVFIGDADGLMEIDAEGVDWMGAGGPGHLRHLRHVGGHWREGGFLGIGLTELTPELRRHFGVPEEAGVMVSKVMPESAAESADLQVGDVVTAVDGEEVASGMALARRIGERESGETVNLEVWRDGRVQTLPATLGEMPPPAGHHARVMKILCDDEERDCEFELDPAHLGCDGGDCEIQVICKDGECTCEVDGEPRDCSEVQGVHTRPG